MPLHEWADRGGWEGMRHLWLTELLRWVRPRLRAGYRAYIGSAPLLAVGAPLPTLPLPLTVELAIPVDLEQTYTRVAADAYLP